MYHNDSIYRQNIWGFFEKIKKMLILGLSRKYDNALILRSEQASARRMASQIVTLSGLTRVKSALRIEYDVLSLIQYKAVYVVDTVSQLNFQPPNLYTDISVTIFVGGFLRRPKGSGSERHHCNMAQFELDSKAQ